MHTTAEAGASFADDSTFPLLVLTTGGTIDKVYFDANSEFHVGPPEIEAILRGVGVTTPFVIETLFRKDSLDLTDDDRSLIRDRVLATNARRVLITHGTDTMVETATALTPRDDQTIVLVGALSPARFKGSDAEFNIGFALAAAQLLSPGVYIAMNGQTFLHDGVQKNRSRNRFETLGSPSET